MTLGSIPSKFSSAVAAGALSAMASNVSEVMQQEAEANGVHPVSPNALVVGENTTQKIHEISKKSGLDEEDVLGRALILLEAAVDASNNDESVVILDNKNSIKARITGLINRKGLNGNERVLTA